MNTSGLLACIQWVIIIFAGVGVIKSVLSHNVAGTIVAIVAAAVGIFFISKPEIFIDWGAQWGPAIGKMFK